MAEVQGGFYRECSPTRCDDLIPFIKKRYNRGEGKPKPRVRRIKGASVKVLKSPELGMGLPMEVRRCFQYEYIDKKSKEVEKPTCTAVANYSVPKKTINCYKKVASILQTLRPIRRGRPAKMEREKIGSEVLGLAGCSANVLRNGVKRMEYEALTPTIASIVTGHELLPVRGAINNLVWQGKLVGSKKLKGERAKKLIHVLQEKSYSMPKPYAIKFDDFIHAEAKKRDVKKLFGASISAVSIPSTERRVFRHGAEIIRKGQPLPSGFQMGATAIRRAEAEEEEWRRRTRIRQPRFVALGSELL